MTDQARTRAPEGDLATFDRERFVHAGVAHDVYRKGRGPAVIVITEMPGITPQVLGFADRVVALGCTAVLPDLFGTPGRDPRGGASSPASYTGCARSSRCASAGSSCCSPPVVPHRWWPGCGG